MRSASGRCVPGEVCESGGSGGVESKRLTDAASFGAALRMTQKASDSPCHSRAKRRIPVLCRVPVAPSLGSSRASGALRFARLSQIESKLHSHQVFHLRPKRRLELCYTRTRDKR